MKMKNLFLSILAIAGMLSATSCLQETVLDEPVLDDFVTAQFSIQTPDGIDTRAAVNVGKGTTVNYVACAVYDSRGEEMTDLRQYLKLENKAATYSIRLVKGQAYRVAFFAYCGNADGSNHFYNLTDLKNITITDAGSNLEERDAFTNVVDVTAEESMKPVDKDVTLYRPFAQLNLGSYKDDIAEAAKAGVVVTQSKITVNNVYTAFSAYDNEVVGNTSEVTFTMNVIPGEDLMVDTDNDGIEEEFEYLALNYLLVGNLGSEKDLTDVEFVWNTADNKTNNPTTVFKNIPVQRNYRTNIIGYLLTNPAVFNITIDEKFKKPDYIVYAPWDGEETKKPASTDTEWLIASPSEWVWLKKNGVSGKNIKLTANLDFGGNEVEGLSFKGEFDGQGHTMSNMTLLCGASYYSNGLLCPSSDATVKNLTIEKVEAECSDPNQGYVGVIFGDTQNGMTLNLENIHVSGADLCGVQSVGGLVGFVASGTTVNMKNCSISDSYLHNYAVVDESGFVAGLIGRPVGNVTAIDCNVESTTIDAYYAPRRGETSIQAAIGGQDNPSGVTVSSDVIVKKTSMDEVVLVSSASELENLNVSDKIILLTADIDFAYASMTKPIQMWGNSTFDGQGYKISNVVAALQGGYASSLFRGDANGGNKVVKNLVVENLKTAAGAGTFASAIWSDLQNGANIEIDNVHVYNAMIESAGTIGGFVGFIGGGSTSVKIKNSSINNSTLIGGEEDKKRGAVVGRAYGCSVTCEDVLVNNVMINNVSASTATIAGDKGYTGSVTISNTKGTTDVSQPISNADIIVEEGAAISVNQGTTFATFEDPEGSIVSGVSIANSSIEAEVGISTTVDAYIKIDNVTFKCDTAIDVASGNSTIMVDGCNFIVPEGGKIIATTGGGHVMYLLSPCKVNGVDATPAAIQDLCVGCSVMQMY